ncbi:FHA domain-containing protein [Crossiella sp. CA-258035]|uniref:FHA domain-containing protein n=1 Tax=Crossiella sp. CA-258035 TaxID=2981138 RepID=UPI0024BD59A0|nr:FHA domain-containing protein [Crossiella sp. CA-258035]WHT19899.1 FHA domain-containing protein [Crossiella sp. CA-258035]
MADPAAHEPRFTVVSSGPMHRFVFLVPPGRSAVGRAGDIALPSDAVSRRHACLDRSGDEVTVSDLGSTNGTWLNGQRLHGPQPLRDGDLLRLGGLELRYAAPEPSRYYPGDSYQVRDLRGGAINIGPGEQHVAGRDQYDNRSYDQRAYDQRRYDQRRYEEAHITVDNDPMTALTEGAGVGRLVMVVGLLVALAGFALFAWTIFSGMSGISGGRPVDPFSMKFQGLPAVPLGFGAFAAGGILASIGGAMAKAARRRKDRAERRRNRY